MTVFGIVVTYNGLRWAERCFTSLLTSTLPVKVIAIDNGSTDGTLDHMRRQWGEVEVIETGCNLGFGKANNIGMQKAIAGNADYIFLLNQDAWIQAHTVDELVRVHREFPEYGILSPLHLTGDGTGLDNNFSMCVNGHACPGLMGDVFLHREMKPVYEVDCVNAAMWLVSGECLRVVGGFDPLYRHYCEDDDYVMRVKYHGFKVGICPRAVGYHDRIQNRTSYAEWPLGRKYGSRLVGLKDLNRVIPRRRQLWIGLLKAYIKKVTHRSPLYSDEVKVHNLLVQNYHEIAAHRELTKQRIHAFLQ